MSTLAHRIVSESIDAPAGAVYALARQVARMPEWASALASGVYNQDGQWIADSPMGAVRIAMAPDNALGVLDHDVTLPNGIVVHNALRVTPAGDGCVVTFVLLRQPGVTDAAFHADATHIAKDLATLKSLMEQGTVSRSASRSADQRCART